MNNQIKQTLPPRQSLWNTVKIMASLIRDAPNRLIIESMAPLHGDKGGLSERWAKQTLTRLFPNLRSKDFHGVWDGKMAMTLDRLQKNTEPR